MTKVCQDSVVGDSQNEDVETSQSVTIKEPDSIGLEDAKALVDKIGFRVEKQDGDDKQSYVCTQPRTNSNDAHARVFGMDCEMVLTSLGSELARLTLIQFEDFQEDSLKCKTVLDVLVKPDNPVQDYLTRHSGITAKLLEPVSTRLTKQIFYRMVSLLGIHWRTTCMPLIIFILM
jgi:hypothetical protein